jgi:lysophospholipase L1-like esterase
MKLIFMMMLIMPVAQAKTLIVGDSIFALTKEVPNNLRQAGLEFDLRAQAGAKLEKIDKQYELYKEEQGVPSLIIMDGGATDLNMGAFFACLRGLPKCYNKIDEVGKNKKILIDKMKDDGVDRIIFVGVHYLQGWRTPLNTPIDYAMDRFEVNDITTFVDIREPFRRKGLILLDGIHPNAAGSKIISDLILSSL